MCFGVLFAEGDFILVLPLFFIYFPIDHRFLRGRRGFEFKDRLKIGALCAWSHVALVVRVKEPDVALIYQSTPLCKAKDFFDGNLTELPEDKAPQRIPHWQQSLACGGLYPRVRFGVSMNGLQEVKLLQTQLLDATTLKSRSSGYSLGFHQDVARAEFDLQGWHATPVLLVLDLAHGPINESLAPILPGRQIHHPYGLLYLVSAVSGSASDWSSRHGNKTTTLTLHLRSNPQQPETSLVFLGLPRVHPLPLDLQFLDASGQPLPGGAGSSSEPFLFATTPTPRDQVSAIRVRHYTQLKRLLISIPYVPGLPTENRTVDNLFNIRIPHLRIQNEQELLETLGACVQMDIRSISTRTPSPIAFPRFYTNITPRELLADLRRLTTPGTVLRVDPENHTIEQQPTVLRRWLTRLSRFLSR